MHVNWLQISSVITIWSLSFYSDEGCHSVDDSGSQTEAKTSRNMLHSLISAQQSAIAAKIGTLYRIHILVSFVKFMSLSSHWVYFRLVLPDISKLISVNMI